MPSIFSTRPRISSRSLRKPHHLAAQTVQLFFALFQLLAQTLRIALRYRTGLSRRLVHLNGAINFLFERLKIVSRNLRQIPLQPFSQTWMPPLPQEKLGT